MFENKVIQYKDLILNDIDRLVSHPSVRDLKTRRHLAPFGVPIRKAMDEFISIAKHLGFKVKDHDGYAISAQLGESDDHLAILGHLDVVGITSPKEWKSDPFKMEIRRESIFGRGVNDDKGPLIAALYAAKIVYDLNPNIKRSIRIIAGGAEETTWEGIKYYFKENPQPKLGFSPDGNFPIVNGEMGILQVKLLFKNKNNLNFFSEPKVNYVCHKLRVDNSIYKGDKHLSRNPQRGLNAIFEFIRSKEYDKDFRKTDIYNFINNYLVDDIEAEKFNLATRHKEMLPLRVCAMSLNSVGDCEELNLDFRYPENIKPEKIIEVLKSLKVHYNYDIEVIKEMAPLYVDKESELIKKLQKAYKKVMNESASLITKGGASYARALDCGVAFGATFENEDPRPHMSNETMPIASLLKACEIYCQSIYELTK